MAHIPQHRTPQHAEENWLPTREDKAGAEIDKHRPWLTISQAGLHRRQIFIAAVETTSAGRVDLCVECAPEDSIMSRPKLNELKARGEEPHVWVQVGNTIAQVVPSAPQQQVA